MSTISTCPRCSRLVVIPEGLDAAALVRCPLCSAEFPLNLAMELAPQELIPVATSDQALPPIAPSFLLQYGDTAEVEENSHSNLVSEETTETTESPLDADVFRIITKQDETGEESPHQAKPQSLGLRSLHKPKSVLWFFVGIVFSGVVGLAIGYIALAWIMGSRFDFPRPPKFLKPVARFVLPDTIWAEKEQPRKN